MLRLLAIIILCIFLFPPLNVGGIPFRLEDVFFVFIVIFYIKDLSYIVYDRDVRIFIFFLLLFFISSSISFILSMVEGYAPVLNDMNGIMFLLRNIIVFCAGLIVGRRMDVPINQIFIHMFFAFAMISVVSLIQYFDIFSLGERLYLLYGSEGRIVYGITRAIGTVGNPNYASFFQLVGAVLLLSLQIPKGRYLRILYFVSLFLVFYSVIITYSRTGLLSSVVIFAIYVFRRRNPRLIIGSICFLFLVLIYYIPTLSGSRLAILFSGADDFDYTFNGRFDLIWIRRFDQFIYSPFWGIGSQKAAESNTIFSVTTFDNTFLNLLVINGFIGFFIFICFFYFVFRFFRKQQSLHVKSIKLYMFMFLGLIFLFFLTTDLNKSVYFASYFYFSTGLLIMRTKSLKKYNGISSYKYSNS